MRIVDRKTFLTLPVGSVYAKAVGENSLGFDGPCIKHETSGENDWWYLRPNGWDAYDTGEFLHRYDQMREGASFPMESAVSRDGLFEEDALFLIYERADLEALREMVDAAIKLSARE